MEECGIIIINLKHSCRQWGRTVSLSSHGQAAGGRDTGRRSQFLPVRTAQTGEICRDKCKVLSNENTTSSSSFLLHLLKHYLLQMQQLGSDFQHRLVASPVGGLRSDQVFVLWRPCGWQVMLCYLCLFATGRTFHWMLYLRREDYYF